MGTATRIPALGTHFWRLRAISLDGEPGAWSKPGELIVKQSESVPALNEPQINDEVFAYITKDHEVTFRWQAAHSDSNQFNIVVAKDSDFIDVVAERSLLTEALATLNLKEQGKYYWYIEEHSPVKRVYARSIIGSFQLEIVDDRFINRWFESFSMLAGFNPQLKRYQSNNVQGKGELDTSVIKTAFIEVRLWLKNRLGFSFGFSQGESEEFSSGDQNNQTYTHQRMALAAHYRIWSHDFNNRLFNIAPSIGFEQRNVPVFMFDESGQILIRPSLTRNLNLGMGMDLQLGVSWSVHTNFVWQQSVGNSSTVFEYSGWRLNTKLEQRFGRRWLMGYGYSLTAEDYQHDNIEESTSQTSGQTQEFGISIGRDF